MELWLFIVITIATLHFQHKHADLGQSRETFLIGLVYSLYAILLVENLVLFAISLWIMVSLWCFFIVTIFNRRYEKLEN